MLIYRWIYREVIKDRFLLCFWKVVFKYMYVILMKRVMIVIFKWFIDVFI